MEAVKRQREILARARAHGRVDVVGLATDLGVAPETVRRDLRLLAERGLLQRVHGGAYPAEVGAPLPGEGETTAALADRRRIAVATIGLFQGARTVYVDSGDTARVVGESLRPTEPITVVTPSLPVATSLAARDDVRVLLLGGRVDGTTRGTVDDWARRMLEELAVDVAVLSASGVSPVDGLMADDPAAAALGRVAVARSRRRILVGLSSMFGGAGLARYAAVADLEAIVTDVGLRGVDADAYAELGPEVVRV